jgi:hypothetical protein
MMTSSPSLPRRRARLDEDFLTSRTFGDRRTKLIDLHQGRAPSLARLWLGAVIAALHGPPTKILAKSLDDAVFARFGDSEAQEIPLFSMTDFLVLQIFPNLFLGEMWKISNLSLKKFGFGVSWISRSPLRPSPYEFGLPKNSLARFHVFRNKLSQPDFRERGRSQIESRSPGLRHKPDSRAKEAVRRRLSALA